MSARDVPVPLLLALFLLHVWWLAPFRIHARHLLLRQQLIAATRGKPRVRLTRWDRVVMATLARVVDNWRDHLILVKPATVVAWHRAGFRLLWRWRSKRVGRPPIPPDLRALIRKIALENPLWGAPRIHGELQKLGYEVAESTVSTYMPRRRGPPSTTWQTFVRHHLGEIVAMDFFTVHNVWFKPLHVLVLLSLRRRQVIHFSVTAQPTSAFVANNLKHAFPEDTHPTWLLHDRDPVFAADAARAIAAIGMEDLWSSPGLVDTFQTTRVVTGCPNGSQEAAV